MKIKDTKRAMPDVTMPPHAPEWGSSVEINYAPLLHEITGIFATKHGYVPCLIHRNPTNWLTVYIKARFIHNGTWYTREWWPDAPYPELEEKIGCFVEECVSGEFKETVSQ
jgi:hypothetical protein